MASALVITAIEPSLGIPGPKLAVSLSNMGISRAIHVTKRLHISASNQIESILKTTMVLSPVSRT